MNAFLPRFSLGYVFRVTTCAAMLMAWGVSITSMEPHELLYCMIGAGTILGIIVGYRREGTRLSRILACVRCIGWAFAAGYFTLPFAIGFQDTEPVLSDIIFSPTNPAGWLMCFISGAIVFYSFVMLLREWTWSAHDAQMRSERHSTCDAKEQPV
jgi:hypothetical protein